MSAPSDASKTLRRTRQLRPRAGRRRDRRRQARRAGRHALPARAERLPAHRPRARPICLNFGIAREYGGRCHLRFDDTNPVAEERRVRRRDPAPTCAGSASTGASTSTTRPTTSSGSTLCAEELIGKGLAFVCDLSSEEIAASTGARSPSPAATARTAIAPSRRTSTSSRRMRAGEFEPGARTLRAKIDMASPVLRDARPDALPDRQGARTTAPATSWCIYPMYDFAHRLSDAIEGITHSLCTLEFVDHRPLYDWIARRTLGRRAAPQQIEFAPAEPHLHGDEQARAAAAGRGGPRARLGRPAHADALGDAPARLPPAAIRRFCRDVGVAKRDNMIELRAPRARGPRGAEPHARRA